MQQRRGKHLSLAVHRRDLLGYCKRLNWCAARALTLEVAEEGIVRTREKSGRGSYDSLSRHLNGMLWASCSLGLLLPLPAGHRCDGELPAKASSARLGRLPRHR